jgi:hypothetical protein
MPKPLLFILATVPFTALVGCDHGANQGPFGPAANSTLLSPFAGDWKFAGEKTLGALKAAGASDKEIELFRTVYVENPILGRNHLDMTITGNVAVGHGQLSYEYRFFEMHQHGDKVCGKAWHHEDRFDYGDMSKCYARLQIKGDYLYLEVRMRERLPDSSDPDLYSFAVPEGGSADTCEADNPTDGNWTGWMTYVFSRKH